MEHDPKVSIEDDTDIAAYQAEALEIQQRIETLARKGRKNGLLHWISRTLNREYREQQIWYAIEYFLGLGDFEMLRKLAHLQIRPYERSVTFCIVAEATRSLKDVEVARLHLETAQVSTKDVATLTQIARRYTSLFRMTQDGEDLAQAGSITKILIAHNAYEFAADVLLQMTKENPVTGLYLQAVQVIFLVMDARTQAELLSRFCKLVEVSPPEEDLSLLVANVFLNRDPGVRQQLAPFVGNRLLGTLYCHLLMPYRPKGRS
ncbi:MAG: hypothetical protein ABIO72_02940 [Patescibacteria group bacterium]